MDDRILAIISNSKQLQELTITRPVIEYLKSRGQKNWSKLINLKEFDYSGKGSAANQELLAFTNTKLLQLGSCISD